MQSVNKTQMEQAAHLFASAFMNDPAFLFCLKNEKDPQSLMYQFFSQYLNNCKELMLYTTSGDMEGFLCYYRWDKMPTEDFDCPDSLKNLEKFQILEHYYDRDFAVLDIMAVDPAHRGKGYAGKMINFFVSYCKKNGLTPLVEIFSADNVDLYCRRDFEIKHQQTNGEITTFVLEYPL